MDTINARLAALEKSNRRMKLVVVTLSAASVVALVAGAEFGAKVQQVLAAKIINAGEIYATRIWLTSSNGDGTADSTRNKFAILGVTKEGAALVMWDAAQKERV